jgi:hypothetical protein
MRKIAATTNSSRSSDLGYSIAQSLPRDEETA